MQIYCYLGVNNYSRLSIASRHSFMLYYCMYYRTSYQFVYVCVIGTRSEVTKL